MAALPAGSTIGILGGGQLARMLAMAAARLGYHTVVLDPADPCPAAQVCDRQIVAAYDDPVALDQLADAAEVSVIAARSIDGDVRCFEPARNTHADGILVRSQVPSGLGDSVAQLACAHAATLITALDYVGVVGLELFVLADGSILANEYAPRVHNSGHWTELACSVDQFEQHIRAVTGQPLGDPASTPCEMINLIGADVDRVPALLADGDWRVHLYGKAEVRAGRKMGHATRLDAAGGSNR